MWSGVLVSLSLSAAETPKQAAIIASKPTLVSIVAKPKFESRDQFTYLVIGDTNRNYEIVWSVSTNAPHVQISLDTNRVYTFTVAQTSGRNIDILELHSVVSDDQAIYDIEVCEVHKTKMAHKEVPIIYGLVKQPVGEPSIDIQRKSFPHHREYSLGGCVITDDNPKTEKRYVCSECKNAYANWKMFPPISK